MSAGVAFFLLLVGLFHLFAPRAAWYASVGWKLRDAEPSDLYLGMSRVGGGVVSVISVIVLIVSMVHATEQAGKQQAMWTRFQHEMTTQNIVSIVSVPDQAVSATPDEIRTFVQHITAVTVSSPQSLRASTNSYSWYGTYQITCKDGYQVDLIDVNHQGTFGITQNSNLTTPDYEFTSQLLTAWDSNLSSGS